MSIESTGRGDHETPRADRLGRARVPAAELKPLAVPVKVACELVGVGHSTMYELIKQGRVETTTIGKRRLVFYKSLEALLSPEAA
jgi:excisionase family DNA binding protein